MKYLLPLALAAALLSASVDVSAQGRGQSKKAWYQPQTHAEASVATRGVTGSVSVPGRAVSHYWNDQTNRWDFGRIQTMSYNSLGKVATLLEADSATNRPSSRETFAYNAQGLPVESVYQTWNGSAYQNMSRALQAYDSRGRETLYQMQDWRNGSWVTIGGYRTATTYNTAGTLIEEVQESYDGSVNNWVRDGRQTYQVDANNRWTSLLFESWNGTAYEPEARVRNIVWHDWSKLQPASYEEQSWYPNGSTWEGDSRTSITYQPNGSNVSISQVLTAPNTWVNDYRYTHTLDNYGNDVLWQDDEWINNAWVMQDADRNLISYTPTNEVRRKVSQDYNTSLGRFENREVITYSQFTTVLASKAKALTAAAELYPNPTAGTATVKLAGLSQTAPVRLEVLNMLGQVVLSQELRAQQGTLEQPLNLQGQPAGLYVVRLHTAAGLVSKSLLKQ